MMVEPHPPRKKLSEQVAECQVRWFHEAKEIAAEECDPVQMGLVGVMLQSGWGCEPDPKEAAKWLAEAARWGAEMPAGYKLPPDMPPPKELAHLPPPKTKGGAARNGGSGGAGAGQGSDQQGQGKGQLGKQEQGGRGRGSGSERDSEEEGSSGNGS